MMIQKILSGCCALALLAGLAGCGNTAPKEPSEPAAATAPAETGISEETKSADTQLVMELIENYLNMEKPQHESIQTRFGLVTAKKQRPIFWYQDFSYLKTGEAALVNNVNVAYNVGALDADGNDDDSFRFYQDYPENALWLGELGPYDGWINNQTYYMVVNTGEMGIHDYCDLPVSTEQIFGGFASLPKKKYHVFLKDAVSTPEKADSLFSLSETEIQDMEARQNLMKKLWAGESVDTDEATGKNMRSCYAVTYDVPQDYLNPYSALRMNEIFSHFPNVLSPEADTSYYDTLPQEKAYEIMHPVKARLQSGPVHVTLYFDRDSKACVGEKLDLTDCSQNLMDKLCQLELVEPGDRSFLIEKQYFENDFKALPDFVPHLDPAEQKENQAVFWKPCAPGYAKSTHHQIFSTKNYGLQFNVQTELYEITDGKDVIGILQGYDNFNFSGLPDDYLDTETMVTDSEVLTSQTGLTYTIHQVPMGNLFGENDCDPDEIGYMVTCYEEGLDKERGILLSVWDRETAVAIMDDLTLTTAEMPKFFS